MQYVNDITSSINQFKMIYVTIFSKHCKYACIRKINSQILDNEVVVHRKKIFNEATAIEILLWAQFN